jgi:hypothetical protein
VLKASSSVPTMGFDPTWSVSQMGTGSEVFRVASPLL